MLIFILIANLFDVLSANMSRCGIDKLPKNTDFYDMSSAKIELFPWLGILFYPIDGKRLTTPVVLVTKQMVIASALQLNEMPKNDFRALAKVVLGQNCSMPGIPIREYIYHSEFKNTTMASLALIQLDLDHVKQDLMPICPPPKFYVNPTFHAMRLYSETDCFDPIVNIYKMEYVSLDECHAYYRKTGLEMAVLWPKHAACGKAYVGGECRWMEGTALAVRQFGRWRLVGFGLHGPGCQAPSKYIDFLMYQSWVTHNVEVAGKTTFTRMASNHVILRKAYSHLQRFGPCDEEESKYEIYSEKATIDQDLENTGEASYNLTLLDTVEYACVVLRAYHITNIPQQPMIWLRRWCASSSRFCYDQQHVEIKFNVLLTFFGPTTYEVKAYGREIRTMDPMEAMKYINKFVEHPRLPKYNEFYDMFNSDETGYTWVPGWGGGSYKGFKIRRYEVYEHCMGNATMPYDKRFCGQYEFTVEPPRWFYRNIDYGSTKYSAHFVWRYLSQREKLQYPTDGYELIIDPAWQDPHNARLEYKYTNPKYSNTGKRPHETIYKNAPNYIYYIYGHTYYKPGSW